MIFVGVLVSIKSIDCLRFGIDLDIVPDLFFLEYNNVGGSRLLDFRFNEIESLLYWIPKPPKSVASLKVVDVDVNGVEKSVELKEKLSETEGE